MSKIFKISEIVESDECEKCGSRMKKIKFGRNHIPRCASCLEENRNQNLGGEETRAIRKRGQDAIRRRAEQREIDAAMDGLIFDE